MEASPSKHSCSLSPFFIFYFLKFPVFSSAHIKERRRRRREKKTTSSTAVAAGAAKSTCYPPRSLVRLNTKVKRVMRQQQRSTFPCSCLLLLFFFFSAVFLVVVEGHRPHAAFSNTRESRIKIEEQDKGEVLVMPSLDQKRPDHQDIAKMARYLVHNNLWGVMGTNSRDRKGLPWTNVRRQCKPSLSHTHSHFLYLSLPNFDQLA